MCFKIILKTTKKQGSTLSIEDASFKESHGGRGCQFEPPPPRHIRVKNQTGVTLRMNIKMFNGNNLPYKLSLTTDIKLSKAQIVKMIESGRYLGSLLSKLAGPLMKVVVPLAKNILAPLSIILAASAIDAGIQKKIHGS